MVNFGEIIGGSIEWTKIVLFKPFSFKKWLILAFVALMAGYLSNGGCNFNSRSNFNFPTEKEKQGTSCGIRPIQYQSEDTSGRISDATCPVTAQKASGFKQVLPVMLTIGSITLVLILLFMWLGSRFSFVFIDDVMKNDASIVGPFKTNRKIGNSYFLFNLVFLIISLVVFGSIIFFIITAAIKTGIFTSKTPDFRQVVQFLLAFLPSILVIILLSLFATLVSSIARDFVTVIMYKDKIKVIQAWSKALGLLRKNILNFIVYILINIGLAIGAMIIYFLIFLAGFLVLLIPGIILGLGLFLGSCLVSVAFKPVYWLVMIVLLTPVFLFALYCLMSLYLPFGVFFRTFSMKFLGRLDPQYDLFVQNPST